MVTIVALGNKGAEYEDTRHNAGRMVLEAFLERFGFPDAVMSSRFAGRISEQDVLGVPVRVLFPETYMNLSGASVKKAVTTAEEARGLIVVADDLDLPVGTLRISYARGSGGHNGIASVIDAIGTNEFVRVRIGIAPMTLFGTMKKPTGSERVSKFVTGAFTKRERAKIDAQKEQVADALALIITKGRDAAMREYN